MKEIDQLADMLSQEMTRRDFLVHIGVAVVSLVGIGSILKIISNPPKSTINNRMPISHGYGYGNYSNKLK